MPQEWIHWQGQTIDGRFELREYLGGAGDSAVFLTSAGAGQSQRAIKLLSTDSKKVQLQLSLWDAVKKLSHPHIISLFETGQCFPGGERLLYAVMDYAEENLSTILPSRPLTTEEVREMLDPILEALAYLHGQGLVHGHIKPSNIMSVEENLNISCDGIKAVGQSHDELTKPSPYLPPEAGSRGLSTSADVWSLGVTLVEALTRQIPLRHGDAKEVVLPALPFPFRNIAEQCLRPDPQERCTIADIQRELRPAGPLVNSPAADRLAADEAAISSYRRRFLRPAVIGLVLATILGGASLFRHRYSRPEPVPPTVETQAPPAQSLSTETQVATNPVVPEPSAPGKPVRRILPDVSRNSLRTIHGTVKVKVRVYVDPAGNVDRARVESGGPSRYFATKALAAAKQWTFEPPRMNGKNISSQWDLEFQFNRTSSKVREVQELR